jgi:hypothetical protein
MAHDMVGGCRHVGLQRFDVNRHKVLSPLGELIMWSRWMVDSWGYGGYGPFHTMVWIILVIAFVAGVVWRVVRAQQKKSNSQ